MPTAGELFTLSPDARELGVRIGPADRIRLTLVGYGTGSAFQASTARNIVAQHFFSKVNSMGAPTVFPRGIEFTIEGFPKTEYEPAVFVAGACRDATKVHADRGEALQYAPDDASVLMLDRATEKRFNPTVTGDPDRDADGTVNYSHVFSEGSKEGLKNTGEFLGEGAAIVGKGAGSVGAGFFSGLGFVGTVVFVSIAALIIFLLILTR